MNRGRAVILAGGKGTRLRDRSGELPKVLVPIAGKPMLEWQLSLLEREGFGSALVLGGFEVEQLRAFVSSRAGAGLDVVLVDDVVPRGTAGAVFAAWDHLDDEFLLMYGDTVLDVDLTHFHAWHASRPDGVASLLVHPNDHPLDSDLVELDNDDRVLGFHPHPRPADVYAPNLVNAALYWMRKDKLAQWRDSSIPLDFGRDLFPRALAEGGRLYGYRSAEYIKDAGTPKRLDRVANDITSGRVAASNLQNPRPAIFLDRDGTLNIDAGFISRPEQINLIAGAAEAVRKINQAGYLAVLVTNQPVVARGECTEAQIEGIHARLEGLLGEGGAYLDRIYYCPHHPDSGFSGERIELKIQCDCRKPATGMVQRAAADMNIDLSRSFMVGDSTADFLMAERAGVRSIGVSTGAGGLDEKYPCEANYTAPDIMSAVSFVLDKHSQLLAAIKPLTGGVAPGDVLFIGGMARSGKTTIANALAECLAVMRMKARVVSLDSWIHPLDKRGATVLGRYDVHHIEKSLKQCVPGRTEVVTLELPSYGRKSQTSIVNAKRLKVEPGEVLIVEGTIALLCATDMPGRRIYVHAEDSHRRSCFMALQQARGKSPEQAEKLFAERESDETPLILESQKSADFKVAFRPPFNLEIETL